MCHEPVAKPGGISAGNDSADNQLRSSLIWTHDARGSVVPPEKVGMIETAVVFSVPEYQVPPNTGFHLARLVAAGSVQDLNKLALIQ